MVTQSKQETVVCRGCGSELEIVDWSGFNVQIVTCTTPGCDLAGFTFSTDDYETRDLTTYGVDGVNSHLHKQTDLSSYSEERAIDVICPRCQHYPVHVPPGAWADCPKCGKAVW